MAKVTPLRERIHVPIRLKTPFSGRLPEVPPGAAYVLLSVLVCSAETYGRRVVVALADGKRLVDENLPEPPADDGICWDSGLPRASLPEGWLRVRLRRAKLVPPNADVAVYVTGTDGAEVPVVLEGIFSHNVA